MRKILIDSDICLDVFLQRTPFVQYSARILTAAEQKNIRGFVSAIAFDNMFYVLRKNSDRNLALDKLKNLRSIVSVAKVLTDTVDKALYSGWNDFEDALQYHSAIISGCEAVVTRNHKDYLATDIPVFSPGEFISTYLSV